MGKEIRKNSNLIKLESMGDNIIRVVYTTRDAFDDNSSIGIAHNKLQGLEAQPEGDCFIADAGRLKVKVNPDNLNMQWNSKNGRLFDIPAAKLARTPVISYTTGDEAPIIKRVKTVDGERNFVENLKPVEDHEAYRCKIFFNWADDEAIHGLGQAEEGIFNLRGKVQYLYQHNMRIPIPFFISDKGYGVLIDCGCLMTFNDDERGSYVFLKCVEQLDFYVIYGDSFDEIIAGFRQLTGKAAMLPKWAFGYVQSKEKYSSAEELVQVAKKYRELNIPIDCVVQDWKTWEGDSWGCKVLDQSRYPDQYNFSEKLKELNVHSMVSVWPNMNSGTPDYDELMAAGKMLNDLATYDAFDEQARKIYWNQAKKGLYDKGFESWWCDSTEPFSGPDWNGEELREPWERFEIVGKEHEKFLGQERANLYATYHAKGMFENQRADFADKRVLNLTRSGYAGIQKYGTMLWSGDISARWDVLRKQIVEALNMASSGMPYWTFDIGGFFVVHENWQARGCDCNNDDSPKWFWHGDYENGIADDGYKELYVRWLQMGLFLPMFRSHGTDTPREIWNFGKAGEKYYDAIAYTIKLRYRLMPYIYSLAGQVNALDRQMIEPLYFQFSADKEAKSCDSQFMLGKELLICPVTEENADTWNCYLPSGCDWYDFETGAKYQGGQWLNKKIDLISIPVFVKAGSIIPMEAALDYATQKVSTSMEIRIYEGADGAFTFYEDAGDGYDYENGASNLIEMKWNDAKKELTIASSKFNFDGGITGRKCVASLGDTKKEFTYDGNEITINF